MTNPVGYLSWFETIGLADVASVGGKNASLGELYSKLGAHGVRLPNGFALTAQSYYDALNHRCRHPRRARRSRPRHRLRRNRQ
jgi:pyruvate,water dikinase